MNNLVKKNSYDETSIQILEGLEAVRKRPGMYIGSTDYRGLHHLVWEIVDNSIDEAMAGYGNKIIVTMHKDNSISILDEGRGVPVGKHSSGKSTPEVVYSILHAGGKFGQDDGYKTAAGLHGVGASVVNALSEYFDVTIYRDGKIHHLRFENGGKLVTPLEVIGNTYRNGTLVHFKPDKKIFSNIEFNYSTISERLKESAFLIKNLEIVLIDQIGNRESTFNYENGLVAFIEFLNEAKTSLHSPVFFEYKDKDFEIEIAFQFCEEYDEHILSFVNNLRTHDGGTHEVGFKSALTKCFNDYARKYNFIKERDKNFEGSDVREGLSGIVSIKIGESLLQFEGQTKSKLGTADAKGAVENMLLDRLNSYLEENKEVAQTLIAKAMRSRQAKEAARKARETARKIKSTKQERILSGKLTPAQSKNKIKNELFIVEGDSAGGSAKQGRDRHYQAILPLRGKVINSERANLGELLKNEEISTIIHTLGGGFGDDFQIKNVNYGKLIIMTDADTDGAHIQILLLTFVYRYLKPMIENDRVFIACPPLFKISKKTPKGDMFDYAWDEFHLEELKQKYKNNYYIQRYKGLGEMNADQLWDTTMNPSTRSLIKVNLEDAINADRRVSILMGNKVDVRRKWIEENVKFTMEDDYNKDGEING